MVKKIKKKKPPTQTRPLPGPAVMPPAGYSIESERVDKFTIEEAKWFLEELERLLGERPLNRPYIRMLAESMRNGTFNWS